jgi:broad specificity phosphatase PhoE
MTTFFFIRHAACNGLGHTLWGRTPGICLNETGNSQAQRLAERFNEIKLKAIYSSPLERALHTAEMIAARLNLEVKKSTALNEIDFGEWTGKPFEVLARDERWRHFNTHRSLAAIPGGESFAGVQDRIVKELNALAGIHGNANVALVSHADVIRAAICYLVGISIDLIERLEISPCSVSVVALHEAGATLLTVNNRSELSQLWSH